MINLDKTIFNNIISYLEEPKKILPLSICNKNINNKFKIVFNNAWKQIKLECLEQKKNLKKSTTWQFFLIDQIDRLDRFPCSSLVKILHLSQKMDLLGISFKTACPIIFHVNQFNQQVQDLQKVQDQTLITIWPDLRSGLLGRLNETEMKNLAPDNEKELSKIRESISWFSKEGKIADRIDLMKKKLIFVPFDLYTIKISNIVLSRNIIKYMDCTYFQPTQFLSICATNNIIKFINFGNNRKYYILGFEENSLKKFDCGTENTINIISLAKNELKELNIEKVKINDLYIQQNPLEKLILNEKHETKIYK